MHDEGMKDEHTYVGRGETLEKAFSDAATRAVEDDRSRNVGRQFEVVRWVVTVDNPRITEHKVTINAS